MKGQLRNGVSKTMLGIIKKLDNYQFNYLKEVLKNSFDAEQIKKFEEYYASKHLEVYATKFRSKDWVSQYYKNELGKINYAINNEDFIKEFKGLKIIVYGKTGTGKTSLVKKIIELNRNCKYRDIDFTNLVSPKMGQTQINLMSLAYELNSFKEKTIVFLDELDSIVTSRDSTNDMGEHFRIVGTFIKFLDSLNSNVIFIAATNVQKNVDEAILRRFNIAVQSRTIGLDQVIKILAKELDFTITTQELNLLKTNLADDCFTFSDITSFMSKYRLDLITSSTKYRWANFLLNFRKKFSEKLEISLTRRKEIDIERVLNG
ncbi:ATP-binding protein [Mycoplasma sp. ATU-Cv-703]|uniref:AAA family ATPase n=1 Tax=Mycoplasma sp. ATU-Cv-703 TaxID=2498595 RepID=UPI001374CCAE